MRKKDNSSRKYEVFISSTFEDLKEIRHGLIEATIKCGQIPSGMEYFKTGAARDTELIRQRIKAADIFAIFLGARYGSKVKKQGIHFMELEYRHACRMRKPILAFLLEEKEFSDARSQIKEGDSERRDDTPIREFRKEVMSNPEGSGRIVQMFSLSKPDALFSDYGQALRELCEKMEQRGSGGWIRADLYDRSLEKIALGEDVGKNPFFRRFVTKLNAFDTLSHRVEGEVPQLKQAIARFFLNQYLGRMIASNVRKFFFESGSSIAFLSKEFIDDLAFEPWMRKVSRELRIHTNNTLTYLVLTCNDRRYIV